MRSLINVQVASRTAAAAISGIILCVPPYVGELRAGSKLELKVLVNHAMLRLNMHNMQQLVRHLHGWHDCHIKPQRLIQNEGCPQRSLMF